MKEQFVQFNLESMQDILKQALPLKIMVNTDEKSLYYFNRNLLTPAEFLNSFELSVRFQLHFSDILFQIFVLTITLQSN